MQFHVTPRAATVEAMVLDYCINHDHQYVVGLARALTRTGTDDLSADDL